MSSLTTRKNRPHCILWIISCRELENNQNCKKLGKTKKKIIILSNYQSVVLTLHIVGPIPSDSWNKASWEPLFIVPIIMLFRALWILVMDLWVIWGERVTKGDTVRSDKAMCGSGARQSNGRGLILCHRHKHHPKLHLLSLSSSTAESTADAQGNGFLRSTIGQALTGSLDLIYLTYLHLLGSFMERTENQRGREGCREQEKKKGGEWNCGLQSFDKFSSKKSHVWY